MTKTPKNDSTGKPNLFEEKGWLDHLENDLEPNLKEDLDLLLKNSKADRKIYASLKKTREAVKKSDDVLLPESGHYYQDLHDRIMAAVEAEAPKSSTTRIMKRSRFAWQTVAGAVSMTMMVALVSWMTTKSISIEDQDRATASAEVVADEAFDRDLAQVADSNVSEELNGFQSEEEFVNAALEEKLKNLSPAQADALLASLQ